MNYSPLNLNNLPAKVYGQASLISLILLRRKIMICEKFHSKFSLGDNQALGRSHRSGARLTKT